jgi:hypothetical protein
MSVLQGARWAQPVSSSTEVANLSGLHAGEGGIRFVLRGRKDVEKIDTHFGEPTIRHR